VRVCLCVCVCAYTRVCVCVCVVQCSAVQCTAVLAHCWEIMLRQLHDRCLCRFVQGHVTSKVDFRSVVANNGRFPPSIWFALAFAVILLVHVTSLWREHRRLGTMRFLTSGWTWVDLASALLCCGIVTLDLLALVREQETGLVLDCERGVRCACLTD